jgi:hypothetical protein
LETDDRGTVLGHRIEIHEGEANIVVHIFRESSMGRSLTTIAHGLNKDGLALLMASLDRARFKKA